ncbi:GntP family gluconate:H+ symporter [Chromohalobacter marismortui]|uniref:GntP family gluconate:H+ symporter n=1 Tax=Chromohalobacter marismortui TaxID=42055 RepID=A0A4R7NCN3_9GAMM|nr:MULTISPECIES: gluconate:H+ symporter [Chromohalobacter]MCI0509886.1 GntP family permease [Chromohalobacter sp.]MCI0591992.1 GntP family permease [Chromohalobacter sp.]TDU18175.1 GntP family gluconate:H+ symporter [Chromohalobacter marismortui]
MTETAAGPQVIIGLGIAIFVMIALVLKTRVHALLALIIAASIAGLIGGMPPNAVIGAITDGFGSTLSTIGLVIGFGVMMGRILEVSGAGQRMAYSILKMLGKEREDWAMALTGYIVSIPIFCDSAYVILNPLVRALARNSGRSVLALGIALASGLAITHSAVPPTPGPLGVAGIFGVDVGLMIAWGIVFTIPALIVMVLYARFMGPRIEAMIERDVPDTLRRDEDEEDPLAGQRPMEELPTLLKSVMPIALPIALIFLNTLVTAIVGEGDDPALVVQIVQFVGHPVIAVGIGVLVAVYGLVPKMPRDQVLSHLEKGVESAGIILLVTGAGGALGAVLRASGAGDYIGESVASLAMPAFLIPFIIATLVRFVQGSGTVSMITGASISAPILSSIPDVNLVLAAQAACLGGLFFSYFNDSYFWVVNRMLGVRTAKHQLLVLSVPTTLGWAAALVALFIANAFVG